MNGEKPEPKTWEDINKAAEINIGQLEMQLALEKSALVTANDQLLNKK